MQSDAGQEERDQQFRHAPRQIADSWPGAFGQRESRQEGSHNCRHTDVHRRESEREEQAHGHSELRLAHSQSLLDMRRQASHGVGAPLGRDHCEAHCHRGGQRQFQKVELSASKAADHGQHQQPEYIVDHCGC